MDLDLYSAVIRRYWKIVMATMAVIGFGSWMVLHAQSPAFEGSILLALGQPTQQSNEQATFYQYGEYYNFQGSASIADYLGAQLRDPASVAEIMRRAQLPLPQRTALRLGRTFDIRPSGEMALQVVFETGSAEESNRAITALRDVARERIEELQQQGLYSEFQLIAGDVFVQEKPRDPLLITAIAVALSFFAGMVLLVLFSLTIPQPRRP